jgi:fucose permease
MTKQLNTKILPVFLGFFVMGFVDIIGISVNYIKNEFALSDFMSNILPLMLFIWFFILSLPAGILMNKIGRKNTVMLSIIITAIALIIPYFGKSFNFYLFTFAMLGIGNTILQVSLNPLLTNLINQERLSANLTLGQFIKAISSFLGPFLAAFMAKYTNSWSNIFLIYSLVSVVNLLWLVSINIGRENINDKNISFRNLVALIYDKYILLFFIGIIMVVGIDVGLNTTVPKFLMKRFAMPVEEASLGSSLYFAARTLGTFIGSILLARINVRKFFIVTSLLSLLFYSVLLITDNLIFAGILIFFTGISVANIFSIIFSFAIQHKPDKTNEISGLMIMGVSGGAIILPIMGRLTDLYGLIWGMVTLLVCMLYIFLFSIVFVKKG